MSNIVDNMYVVLDVETNGLSSLRDDLFSVSIYQPDTGKMFNKFLPLELNSKIYTTHINGITKKDLENATAFTQEEIDDLIREYDLENRTILTYSSIDEKFMKNYMKRKRLKGYEKLQFYNFKRDIISSRFSEGNITKDNLCKIYGIDNVLSIHSGENDCLLEWELFKKMNGNKLLVTHNDVFEFNNEYIVPVTYLSNYTNFKYCVNVLPKLKYQSEVIYTFELLKKNIKKFDTNISGMTIEHVINTMLSAKEVDSRAFLTANKRKLKYIGKLPSVYDEIRALFNADGTITAIDKKDEIVVKEINKVIEELKKNISPLIDFIRNEIFLTGEILSQELVIHKDENLLALCDLSNSHNVLEIKTSFNMNIDKFKYQLYYQANGRNCFVLQIDWEYNSKKICFIISKVCFEVGEVMPHTESQRQELRTQKYCKKIADKSNGHIEVVEYLGSKDDARAKCSKCGHEWIIRADRLLARPYCPMCK